ncbi:hypothetical protein DFR65_1119 [Oceanihabitans sediminis]|uniref:O-antigen ligase domain-containing protein n=1 Tax=Oceanihabitans sediminis TaxID=1812012 RepID=A0A368P897_9FLAO|nr:hypothetical protein [Oceanihabitans sediminis]RBP27060.1 hypothetical protein DFR65_1119 [Oceanihabitans sediminis]RCU58623.1 hypothetical protein DU428_04395 [Oceanihabitans sediminis]
MDKIKIKLFYLMIFLVFTQGMWERILLFSTLPQVLLDASILAFILYKFNYSFKVPGAFLFLMLCVVAFFVGFANGDSVIDTFMYLRFLVYTYLIYNQLFSNPISLKRWNGILKLIAVMIILQGFGALFNIFILGERVEGYVGLMSSLGGTTATVFPLLISAILLVYYLFVVKLNTKITLVLSMLLFSGFLVGFSSGKRGIYFIIPLVLISIIIIAIPKLRKFKLLKRKLVGLASLGLLIFPLIIYGMVNSKGLNYSLTGNESAFEVISNSLEYAEDYENATDQYGRTIGRSNTSTRIIENTLSSSSFFFFGEGYGATKEESTMLKLGYYYGIVGFSRDIISGGLFLCLLTILLFYKIILNNNSIRLKFSAVMRYAMIIVFLYTYFFYSSDFTISLKINAILVIVMVLLNSPKQRVALVELLKRGRVLI